MERKRQSFAMAMKKYFGLLSGQSLSDFVLELKALSYEEKMDFAVGLRSVGFDCEDPTK